MFLPYLQKPPSASELQARPWHRGMWIAAAFSMVLGLVLVVGQASLVKDDPLETAQLKAQRDKLRKDPTNERLKTEIRQLDLRLRSDYFHHLSQRTSGVYLLIGGAVLFVLSGQQWARVKRGLPMPVLKVELPERDAKAARWARWAVTASGLSVLLLLLTFGLAATGPYKSAPDQTTADAADTKAGDVFASIEELRQNWPRFRGVDGNGSSPVKALPKNWDPKTGAGIAWKIAVPAQGFNSPILWNNRLLFCGMDGALAKICCLESEAGKIQWQQTLPTATAGAPDGSSIPLANASMATDGRRVYAFFGDGRLTAFTIEGKALWSKTFGPLKNAYGHGASLATWRSLVFLQLDQGDRGDGKSELYAFEGRTGKLAWQKARPVGSSWATPLVVESAGTAQVITLAVPAAISYSALDGKELWRMEGFEGEITPSPVTAGGLVYLISPSEKLTALRPDGTDATNRVAWTSEDNVPDITSPAGDGELLFILASSGVLTCLDGKSGKKQWDHDFEMEFHASPGLAGGCVYLFGLKGTAIVVEAARQFREVFRTEMADSFQASPVFAPGKIFLRGETNVWCIGAAAQNLASKP